MLSQQRKNLKFTKQKAVIFDLGNVLVKVDNYKALPHFKKHLKKSIDDHQLEHILWGGFVSLKHEDAKHAQIFIDLHLGKITGQALYRDIVARDIFLNSLSFAEFKEHWSATRFQLMSEVLELVKQLKYLHRFVLSDTNELDFNASAAKFPELFNEFDELFLSHKQKVLKYDLQAWKNIIAHSGLPAEVHLYIDDRKDHVERAKSLGMQGIVFTNAKNLEQKLRFLGYLE